MKSSWSSTSIIPVTLYFLFSFIHNFGDVLAAPTRHLCRPEQRDALVKFKNEFEIGKRCRYCLNGHPKTESWGNNSDCCNWEGITCDAKSGEVIKLNLTCSSLHGRNNFVGEIPSSFGNLNQLTTLDVSYNKLTGNFPNVLLNLTGLSSLSLSNNQFTGTLPPNITSLSNLMGFYANYNAFAGTFPSFLFTIPSLTEIDLSHNQLKGTLDFGNISSPSNLEALHIGSNNFTGTLPPNITSLSNLTGFYAKFGNISSPSNLLTLYIGSNNFIGPIPRSISKFVNLGGLDLSHLNTQAPVDFGIFSHLKSLEDLDLSHLNTPTTIDLNNILSYFKRLGSLDLSGNHVSATNKSSVSDLPPQLIQDLNLSGCGITEFPEFVRTQPLMTSLDISNNKIKGQVPNWLWRLPNLFYVNLSNNTFMGFERPTKPELSSVRNPSIEYLLGSNNSFTGKIPSFICELRFLNTLDLSDNNFNGSIPRCMGNFKTTLSVLNLRQNNLSGGLPKHIFEILRSLDVGHNQLVGKLPRSLIRFSTLQVLNVESNRITDTFPFWLRIIDISNNHFNGTLPTEYFVKWSGMSSLGKNEDQSNEKYMGSAYYHDSIVLMNRGVALELVRILKIYTAIDFSGNKFEGEIPKSIGLLKELHVLNLSNNAFTGRISSSMGNLRELESLDISQNKLSGEIPQELGNLSYLAYMNFSHNQLAGLVPGGHQFLTQPCSSFKDNPGLFGSSLEEVCRDIQTPASHQQNETPETEEEEEEVISWIAAAIGFIPGIALGLTIGYILLSYKPKWFMNPFGRNNRRSRSTATH
ncbi:Leucine-rich repeat typical subtype [Arabidopsis thaliana x Arabidopsis arenosa]|uniref:Leucine-rich repeat typical subtype n=1 Tax=Arabidopsis thaliana x Arabidopsis arenosa TaxID=1240361 RepID=A0A8T2AT35_9BRAS|nr:Leucine-rich repeat typical subtype [Arabidopsis thaliana x Arabidopsis arenosa]